MKAGKHIGKLQHHFHACVLGGSIFQMRCLVVFDPFWALHFFHDTRVALRVGTRWSRGNPPWWNKEMQPNAANSIEEIQMKM